MKYNFPEIKFVQRNTIQEQFEHIKSEFEEAEDEYRWMHIQKFFEEMADLTHSIETFWRIVERTKGKTYLENLFLEIIEKNKARNYYTP